MLRRCRGAARDGPARHAQHRHFDGSRPAAHCRRARGWPLAPLSWSRFLLRDVWRSVGARSIYSASGCMYMGLSACPGDRVRGPLYPRVEPFRGGQCL
eukprot:scaffold29951_cov28-Tisochrysis_lutea.AAC.3